jgi:hypothetical protein
MRSQHAYWRWSLEESGRLAKRLTRGQMYYDRNRELRVNLIITGTARSGTTWLAEFVVSQLNFHLVHEAFFEAFGLVHLYGDGDVPLFQNRAWLPSAEARNQ